MLCVVVLPEHSEACCSRQLRTRCPVRTWTADSTRVAVERLGSERCLWCGVRAWKKRFSSLMMMLESADQMLFQANPVLMPTDVVCEIVCDHLMSNQATRVKC